MRAREQTDKDDTEALRVIADRITEMEKARRVAGEALHEHARSHGKNGC
jgi:hypothetical protein